MLPALFGCIAAHSLPPPNSTPLASALGVSCKLTLPRPLALTNAAMAAAATGAVAPFAPLKACAACVPLLPIGKPLYG